MKQVLAGAVVLFASVFPTNAQKKPVIPEVITKARYVMVLAQREAEIGQQRDFEDERVIGEAESALAKWGRYKVVYRKDEADLIITVRRAATVTGRIGGGVGGTGNGQRRGGTVIGAEGAAPSGDYVAVFNARSGPSGSPLWRKVQKDGLAAPKMPLLKLLEEEVEAAAKTP
jgi:hypothetical protein